MLSKILKQKKKRLNIPIKTNSSKTDNLYLGVNKKKFQKVDNIMSSSENLDISPFNIK